MRRLRVVAAALALSAVVAGCSSETPSVLPQGRIALVRLSQEGRFLEVHAEIAETPLARGIGLMGRKQIPPGRGMLFLFPGAPAVRVFWMKNTLVPLDIAFIRDRRVTEVRRMVPCRTEQCPTTRSAEAADYALELAAGSLAAAGIGPGATVSFLGDLPTPS